MRVLHETEPFQSRLKGARLQNSDDVQTAGDVALEEQKRWMIYANGAWFPVRAVSMDAARKAVEKRGLQVQSVFEAGSVEIPPEIREAKEKRRQHSEQTELARQLAAIDAGTGDPDDLVRAFARAAGNIGDVSGLHLCTDEEIAMWEAERRESEITHHLQATGIKEKYAGLTLDSYREQPGADLAVHETALRWMKSLEPRGLFLYGDFGMMKTGLSAALLKALIERYNRSGKFVVFVDLLDRMKQAFGPGKTVNAEDIMQDILDTPFLVIDDLGAEKATEWVAEQLFRLVNWRLAARKVTIYTSNYSAAELHTRLTPRDVADPKQGERIVWRIIEHCGQPVHVQGRNQRDVTSVPITRAVEGGRG